MKPISLRDFSSRVCAPLVLERQGRGRFVGSRLFNFMRRVRKTRDTQRLKAELVSKPKSKRLVPDRVCARVFGSVVAAVAPGAAPALVLTVPRDQALVNLLIAGRWGGAFMSPAAGLRIPEEISATAIDRIFAWDVSVTAIPLCLQSYANVITDLLQLPKGRDLIRDIIVIHHKCPGLGGIKFFNRGNRSFEIIFGGYDTSNVEMPSEITLQWTAANVHEGGRFILPVNNTAAGQLDFVQCQVPAAVPLAHELGHHLDAIAARYDMIKAKEGLIDKARQLATDSWQWFPHTGVAIAVRNKFWKAATRVIAYMEAKAKNILRHVVSDGVVANFGTYADLPPGGEKTFLGFWSAGGNSFIELSNVLPRASILNDGHQQYSDGAIAGEALDMWSAGDSRQPQFFNLANVSIVVNRAGLPPESFVRIVYENDAASFNDAFGGLAPAEQAEFRQIVGRLLSKITTPQGLSLGNLRNLPSI